MRKKTIKNSQWSPDQRQSILQQQSHLIKKLKFKNKQSEGEVTGEQRSSPRNKNCLLDNYFRHKIDEKTGVQFTVDALVKNALNVDLMNQKYKRSINVCKNTLHQRHKEKIKIDMGEMDNKREKEILLNENVINLIVEDKNQKQEKREKENQEKITQKLEKQNLEKKLSEKIKPMNSGENKWRSVVQQKVFK